MWPDLVSVSIRALSFVLLLQAAGAAFFICVFSAQTLRSRVAMVRLSRVSAAFGAVFVMTHLLLEAARMTGEFSGLVDPSMQRVVWTSSTAASHIVQTLGLLLIALTVSRRPLIAGVGALLSLAGFLLTGHTSAGASRAWLAPTLLVHLLVIAFWFGSLAPLWLISKRESAAVAQAVLQRFSTLATWSVPLIFVAGAVLALSIVGGIPSLDEPYDAIVWMKVSTFVVLMCFAAWNKWRLVPAFALNQQHADESLRRSIAIEYALIIGVIALTAVMTAFYSPGE
jgi:putative copper resistance protein D